MFIGDKKVYLFAFILAIVKVCLLPFSHTVDPDAVSRMFIALEWFNNPVWIPNAQWLPGYFYVHGLWLGVIRNFQFAPALLNITLSSLCLIPFYKLVQREFSNIGAFHATVLLGCSSVVFRNSMMAMSMPLMLIFLLSALNQFSLAFRKNSYSKHDWFTGLGFALACSVRYEAWAFALLVCLWAITQRKVILSMLTFIVPFALLLVKFIPENDAGTGLEWFVTAWNERNNLPLENILRRIWFFPFSWMVTTGSLPVLALVVFGRKSVNEWIKSPIRKAFAFAFLLCILLYITNSLMGTLLLQHRFSIILTVLTLPFVSFVFEQRIKRNSLMLVVFVVSGVCLSYIYNTDGVRPLPRLENLKVEAVANQVKPFLPEEASIVIDFVDWESSYYLAYELENMNRRVVLLGKDENIAERDLKSDYADQIYLLAKKGGDLESWATSTSATMVDEYPELRLVLWRTE